MTLYGVGLGPGDAGLVTVRGREVLQAAEVVYSPGRLSRSVATEHVPEERIGDLDFPMTRDEEELREASRQASRSSSSSRVIGKSRSPIRSAGTCSVATDRESRPGE